MADDESSTGPRPNTKPPVEPDLAANTLASVRRSSRTSNAAKGRKDRRGLASSGEAQYSGSGPDERDPALLGEGINNLMRANGWERKSKVGGVIGRWSAIAGEDLAAHVTPGSFDDSSGRLLLRAESTTWATQVRSLIPALQQRLDDEVGKGTVREIEVRGPARKSRNYGPLRVKGRGDRDTYG